MKTSIIVATRNRCAVLKELLQAIALLLVPPGMSPELIVVDNGSRDATSSLVKSFGSFPFPIRHIYDASGGKAAALNVALGVATGEILIFIDDDVHPAPNWLHGITESIVNGQFDFLCGKVSMAPYLLRPWMTKMHKGWLACTDYLDPEDPYSAVGANMAFARRVLMAVPRFDPALGPGRLGLWEDTLFSLQAKRAGFRLGFAKDAVVEHRFDPSRLTRAAFLGRAKAEARSSAYVAWHWKHEKLANLRWRASSYTARLLAKRLYYWTDCHRTEGVSEWEMNLVTEIEFARRYLYESRRPHVYRKQEVMESYVQQARA